MQEKGARRTFMIIASAFLQFICNEDSRCSRLQSSMSETVHSVREMKCGRQILGLIKLGESQQSLASYLHSVLLNSPYMNRELKQHNTELSCCFHWDWAKNDMRLVFSVLTDT